MRLAELYPCYVHDDKFPWEPRKAVHVLVAAFLLSGHRHRCSERGAGNRARRRIEKLKTK